jgi:hypothetical protein
MIGAANLSPVTKLVVCTGPAKAGVQVISEAEICHDAGFILCANARIASRSFSEGWCPGATAIMNLSGVQEQKQKV